VIPYTTEARTDTGVSNVTLGFWLFIASEVMLFGALFSSYALLRVSAPDWPAGGDMLVTALGVTNTALLMALTAVAWRAGRTRPASARWLLVIASAVALLFLLTLGLEYSGQWRSGHVPATSTFFAMYYTLTGIHALHVLGGIIANLWVIAATTSVDDALTSARLRVMSHYWMFVALVWIVMFVGLYLS